MTAVMTAAPLYPFRLDDSSFDHYPAGYYPTAVDGDTAEQPTHDQGIE
jgi:hypothetical protein